MADSNITKRALAASLRELMLEQPFEKINVAQICERCDMNRKSFYYHFKDKYDLLNWIFDTEFIALIKDENLNAPYEERWNLIEKICDYFYANHAFYRKALQIQGQNSFTEHFREYLRPLLWSRLSYIFGQKNVDQFAIDFFYRCRNLRHGAVAADQGLYHLPGTGGKNPGPDRKICHLSLPGNHRAAAGLRAFARGRSQKQRAHPFGVRPLSVSYGWGAAGLGYVRCKILVSPS